MNISVIFEFLKLRRHLSFSRKKMQKLQQKKLHKLLRYAYKNSEFYRSEFTKNGITLKNINRTPLENFPKINKQIFFENHEKILTDKNLTFIQKTSSSEKENPMQSTSQKLQNASSSNTNCELRITHCALKKVHSSGSTGTPKYYFYDKKAWNIVMAAITRGCMWNISLVTLIKALKNGVRFLYFGASDGLYAGSESIGSTCKAFGAEILFLDINEPLDSWREKISSFKPNFIAGYPSALKILAGLLEDGGLTFEKKSVYQIVSCGEPLNCELRKYLEKVFEKTVVNFYGCSESLALGVEYSKEEGLLLFDDLNYIEVIDGKMYLTCLYNFVQPVIRYEISDRLELVENAERQNCHAELDSASPFTHAKIVQSREEDLMWFNKDGKKDFIHPLSVEGICIEGLLDYQFVKVNEQKFLMKIQIKAAANLEKIKTELDDFFAKLLQEKQLNFVQYEIEKVDEIKVDEKSRKKKLVIV